jgi:hypothetical protein
MQHLLLTLNASCLIVDGSLTFIISIGIAGLIISSSYIFKIVNLLLLFPNTKEEEVIITFILSINIIYINKSKLL